MHRILYKKEDIVSYNKSLNSENTYPQNLEKEPRLVFPHKCIFNAKTHKYFCLSHFSPEILYISLLHDGKLSSQPQQQQQQPQENGDSGGSTAPNAPFQGFQTTHFELLNIPKFCVGVNGSTTTPSQGLTATPPREMELMLADVIKTLAVEAIGTVEVALDVEKDLGVMKFRAKVRRVDPTGLFTILEPKTTWSIPFKALEW